MSDHCFDNTNITYVEFILGVISLSSNVSFVSSEREAASGECDIPNKKRSIHFTETLVPTHASRNGTDTCFIVNLGSDLNIGLASV